MSPISRRGKRRPRFRGWSVVRVAFVVATFAWGISFFASGVLLQTLHATHPTEYPRSRRTMGVLNAMTGSARHHRQPIMRPRRWERDGPCRAPKVQVMLEVIPSSPTLPEPPAVLLGSPLHSSQKSR
jgi:hypothetical protein